MMGQEARVVVESNSGWGKRKKTGREMSVGGYLWVVRVVAGELEVDPGLVKVAEVERRSCWRVRMCDVDDGESDDKPLDD